jgi:hypothetical protein
MDIKVGQIILEVSSITIKVAKKIAYSAIGKLPVNSEFIFKNNGYDSSIKN